MKQWKFAWRALVRRPGFALTVVGMLTAGIGANTALFSVVDTVLLKPLPFRDPAQLVTLYEANTAKSQSTSLIAPGRLEDWNRLCASFTAIAGSYTENVTDTSGSEPVRLNGRRVSPRYFAVFETPALVGRTFTADEEQPGGPLAAVISYGLWSRRYGQSPAITSRRLIIGGQGYSIVGVMPKTFASGAVDVWMPAHTPPFLIGIRDARFFSGVGRIKPGVSTMRAQSDLNAVQRSLGEQFPKTDKGWSATVQGLKDARVGDAGKPLALLFAAVALFLLITVTNVASLVLAQLSERERELAIRASIGATRAQVVASVMREITIVSLAGALGGCALAVASMKLLMRFFADVPRINELQTDWRALAFAAGASLLGAAAFGLMPALRATSATRAGLLMRAGRGIAGRRQIVQRMLVSAQVALTMLLLASSGLMLRSFYNMSHVELGFNPANVLLFHVGAAWDEDRVAIGHMQEQITSGLQSLPGVQSAGITNFLPASGATLRYQIRLEAIGSTDNTGKMPAGSRTVSPGYLKAIQAPLLAGGWCPELRWDAKAPPKAMVNRRFVDVYAGGQSVVGRRFYHADLAAPAAIEIVGVIGDLKEDSFEAPVYPYVYDCAAAGGWPDPEYAVRTAGDPRALLGAIRQLVRNVAPNRAIFGVQTLQDALDVDLGQPRTNARLLALFAMAAMLLAAVGLYGLVTQIVNARRREIGVRIALGAEPGQIVRSMVANAGWLIAMGIAAGVLLTLLLQPALRSVIFGVSPVDGVSLLGAALLLAGVSVGAAFLPARGAAAVDPIEAMRAE